MTPGGGYSHWCNLNKTHINFRPVVVKPNLSHCCKIPEMSVRHSHTRQSTPKTPCPRRLVSLFFLLLEICLFLFSCFKSRVGSPGSTHISFSRKNVLSWRRYTKFGYKRVGSWIDVITHTGEFFGSPIIPHTTISVSVLFSCKIPTVGPFLGFRDVLVLTKRIPILRFPVILGFLRKEPGNVKDGEDGIG